jgi:hypothetical protein
VAITFHLKNLFLKPLLALHLLLLFRLGPALLKVWKERIYLIFVVVAMCFSKPNKAIQQIMHLTSKG